MKKRILCLVLCGLLLCGCGAQASEETRLPGHAVEIQLPETYPAQTEAPELTEPQWETQDLETQPPTIPDEIDFTTLEGLQSYTTFLNWVYGVEIHIAEDVLTVTPWDYDLEPETDVAVIAENLGSLEQWLSNYPQDMLATVSEACGGLHISLVRGIYGKKGLGGIPTAAGLQYEDNGIPYIALTSSENAEYTLYHELCHILEPYIIKHSSWYDHWESMNPPDFTYDYDYIQNQYRNGSAYLQTGTRSFIDAYSMSFPTEDRARIMEYAMTPNHAFLFDSPIMQEKLTTISMAIREAFSLTDSEEVYLWEQYIQPPNP